MDSWKHLIKWCQRPNMIKISMFNPGLGRVELSRGARAGAISGAVYGAIGQPIMSIALWAQEVFFRPIEFFPSGRPTLWEMLSSQMMESWFWGSIMMGSIIGVIIGLLFGWIFNDGYNELPGKTPTMKGIVMSTIQWIVTRLLFVGAFHFGWATITMSVGHSILWGWLMGRLWTSERLGKR